MNHGVQVIILQKYAIRLELIDEIVTVKGKFQSRQRYKDWTFFQETETIFIHIFRNVITNLSLGCIKVKFLNLAVIFAFELV